MGFHGYDDRLQDKITSLHYEFMAEPIWNGLLHVHVEEGYL